MRECEERAVRYGLPPLRWPPGWPVESYTLAPLRAALVAEEHGRLRELSLAAFAENFVTGAGIREPEALERAVRTAGLDPDVVRDGIQRPEIKERLREVTDGALAAGVVGVPTVLVDGEAFWGDDQLEQAAARMAA
jgi:2-hydroxychromene-2-carboxylate isomerase